MFHFKRSFCLALTPMMGLLLFGSRMVSADSSISPCGGYLLMGEIKVLNQTTSVRGAKAYRVARNGGPQDHPLIRAETLVRRKHGARLFLQDIKQNLEGYNAYVDASRFRLTAVFPLAYAKASETNANYIAHEMAHLNSFARLREGQTLGMIRTIHIRTPKGTVFSYPDKRYENGLSPDEVFARAVGGGVAMHEAEQAFMGNDLVRASEYLSISKEVVNEAEGMIDKLNFNFMAIRQVLQNKELTTLVSKHQDGWYAISMLVPVPQSRTRRIWSRFESWYDGDRHEKMLNLKMIVNLGSKEASTNPMNQDRVIEKTLALMEMSMSDYTRFNEHFANLRKRQDSLESRLPQ